MTTESAAALPRALWIGKDDRVSIFLVIVSLTVTLSRLSLVIVSF